MKLKEHVFVLHAPDVITDKADYVLMPYLSNRTPEYLLSCVYAAASACIFREISGEFLMWPLLLTIYQLIWLLTITLSSLLQRVTDVSNYNRIQVQ